MAAMQVIQYPSVKIPLQLRLRMATVLPGLFVKQVKFQFFTCLVPNYANYLSFYTSFEKMNANKTNNKIPRYHERNR